MKPRFVWLLAATAALTVYLNAGLASATKNDFVIFESMTRDACQSNADCRNGGSCIESIATMATALTGFDQRVCKCKSGFTGRQCQLRGCPENPCRNNGVCELLKGNSTFKCHCPLGYSGSVCTTQHSTACDTKKCVHGKCLLGPTINDAACACFYGFTGPTCNETNTCDTTTCSAHGSCVSTSTGPTCKCSDGWTGLYCTEDIDECLFPGVCANGGVCRNTAGGFVCSCPPGFVGEKCEYRHRGGCSQNPCFNGGKCTTNSLRFMREEKFTCECPEGFTGDRCEINIDDCAPIFDPELGNVSRCFNGGVCVDGIASYRCLCPSGFAGLNCQENIDECSIFGSEVCQNGGTCIDTPGSFTCSCVIGYEGERCERSVDDCVNNMCYPGSTCVDRILSYDCECQPDRIGDYCQFENPCSPAKKNCAHGKCFGFMGNGSYSCMCDKGWTGSNCDIDIDECAHDPCYRGACHNTNGSFTCLCKQGFTGERCDIAINECEDRPCYHGGTCLDQTADFKCICMPGWTGKRCEEVKPYSPACQSMMCLHGGVCQKTVFGEEKCECPPLFTGPLCETFKPNPCDTSMCRNGATCVPTLDYNFYTCKCEPGYGGIFCSEIIKTCADKPCRSGTCIDLPDNEGYNCTCNEGYAGVNCEINIDDCAPEVCKNGGICIDGVNKFSCSCPATHTGELCELNVTSPCDTNPCLNNATCSTLDLVGNIYCTCLPGFSGRKCEIDDRSCQGANKCMNGGTCFIDGENASCKCLKNFAGSRCELDLNKCSHVTCANNGTCENLIGDFYCRCAYGFAGRHCDEKVDVDRYVKNDYDDLAFCAARNCSSFASNGICNPECNKAACDFDGGDCSAAILKPFAACPYPSYCSRVFGDNRCDSICNVEACLFDGFDCEEKAVRQCPDLDICRSFYGNGVCNPECNNFACGFDGGDCVPQKTTEAVIGQDLLLAFVVDPIHFATQVAPSLLVRLSQILHVTVHYKLDGNDEPMIYHWKSTTGQGSRLAVDGVLKSKRSIDQMQEEVSGVMVYLLVDGNVCQFLPDLAETYHIETINFDGGKHCFSNARSIANMLAVEASRNAFSDLGMSVYSARVMEPTPTGSKNSENAGIIALVVGGLGMTFVVVFVVARPAMGRQTKKKVIQTLGLYIPPRESDLKAARNNHPGHHPQGHHFAMSGGGYAVANVNGYFPQSQNQPLIDLGASGCTSLASSNRNSCDGGELTPTQKPRVFTRLHEFASMAEKIPVKKVEQEQLFGCVNVQDENGCTCIHWAVDSVSDKPDEDVIADIETLVAWGAEIDIPNDDMVNPLHLAIKKGRTQVALYLMDKINVNEPDALGRTALHEAVSTRNFDVVRRILATEGVDVNAVADHNDTALIKCARFGDEMLPVVELLLNYPGIDVNKTGDKQSQNYTGKTALHEAAGCNSLEIMKLIIKKKANTGAQDNNQRTALFVAVESGRLDAVKLLAQHMSDPNTPNDSDVTPLQEAQARGFMDIVQFLRQPALHHGQVPMSMPMQMPPMSMPMAMSMPQFMHGPPGFMPPYRLGPMPGMPMMGFPEHVAAAVKIDGSMPSPGKGMRPRKRSAGNTMKMENNDIALKRMNPNEYAHQFDQAMYYQFAQQQQHQQLQMQYQQPSPLTAAQPPAMPASTHASYNPSPSGIYCPTVGSGPGRSPPHPDSSLCTPSPNETSTTSTTSTNNTSLHSDTSGFSSAPGSHDSQHHHQQATCYYPNNARTSPDVASIATTLIAGSTTTLVAPPSEAQQYSYMPMQMPIMGEIPIPAEWPYYPRPEHFMDTNQYAHHFGAVMAHPYDCMPPPMAQAYDGQRGGQFY